MNQPLHLLSAIVAVDDNFAIGKNNSIPWQLPADLKYFKQTTLGHHIIMGRKSFESIGKALPGRVNIVISRNADFSAPGCMVVTTLKDALDIAFNANDFQPFIIGGAQIYEQAMPLIKRLYITYVNTEVDDADTFFPDLKMKDWRELAREDHSADEKNPHDYSFVVLERK